MPIVPPHDAPARPLHEELGDASGPATSRDLGLGSALHLGGLPSIDGETLAVLTAEVGWQTMSHRGGEVPRLVATQGVVEAVDRIDASGALDANGRIEPLYRHPADDYPPVLPWTSSVARLRDEVSALIGHPFNHCLIQLYRDGRDWIGAHSDKTLDVVDGSFIINVSVGALRTMVLRRKTRDEVEVGAQPAARATQRIPLPHGSVMQMSLATNRDWLHEIRQQGSAGEIGPRISLTFRWIGTFWNPATGAVWGSGSPHQARADAERAAADRAALSEEERLRRELAEAEEMLKLFRQENQSAAFDRAAYRPGFEVVHLRRYQEHAAKPPAEADPSR